MDSKHCPTVLLLATVTLLFSCISPANGQNSNPGQLAHDLSFSLSVSFVAVAVVIMTIVAVIILYRAKKGYFCCMKPRIRYPPVKQSTRRVRSRDPEAGNTPAPTYEVHPRGADIAPPDYEDALQDAVIGTGETTAESETRNENLGDDGSLDCDDRSPLNP